MEVTCAKYLMNCFIIFGDMSRILKTYLRDPKLISEIIDFLKCHLYAMIMDHYYKCVTVISVISPYCILGTERISLLSYLNLSQISTHYVHYVISLLYIDAKK